MSGADIVTYPRTRDRRLPFSSAAAALLLLFSGCLPYSCRNDESRTLTPADSLSRARAHEVQADSLDPLWSVTEPLEYPRTVRFTESGDTLLVSDVERDLVLVFSPEGDLLGEIKTAEVPYIAGIQNDTLAVFSPRDLTIQLIAEGEVARRISIPDADRPNDALVYAAYFDGVFYKRVAPDEGGFILRLDGAGTPTQRYALAGPHWRHAGLLRTWGDTLVSLSGYRPVVDLLVPRNTTARGAGELGAEASNQNPATLDTLALHGFDSPMLARSRSFMLGEVTEAPLLSSSAAPDGPYLFAINIRAGWLQIDVFDRDGRLQHRLVERDPEYRKSFFPQDLDVHRRQDGSFMLAIALSESPELRLYRWDASAPRLTSRGQ